MHPEAYLQTLGNISESNFNQIALSVFRHQVINNPVYARFTSYLGIDSNEVKRLEDIPFLPVSAFKKHRVVSGPEDDKLLFSSSGTTGSERSTHHITDPDLYDWSFLNGFKLFYGDPADWTILALLPSYLERSDSSLIYMMDQLIRLSTDEDSGFYLDAGEKLTKLIGEKSKSGKKTLLLGVSFALLDLAEENPIDMSRITVMETGGFKGRRREISRTELHRILKNSFNISSVHSEYGMTELLSQAYSSGEGNFRFPPWAKVLLRDINDPLSIGKVKRGGINIIDLANYNSCAFIATDDYGELAEDGHFSIHGRIEASDLRGCNMLIG